MIVKTIINYQYRLNGAKTFVEQQPLILSKDQRPKRQLLKLTFYHMAGHGRSYEIAQRMRKVIAKSFSLRTQAYSQLSFPFGGEKRKLEIRLFS